MKRSWSAREWLPNAATLTLIGVTTTPARVVIEADGPASAQCPACGRPSQTRHSRYCELHASGKKLPLKSTSDRGISTAKTGEPQCSDWEKAEVGRSLSCRI